MKKKEYSVEYTLRVTFFKMEKISFQLSLVLLFRINIYIYAKLAEPFSASVSAKQ